MAFNEVLPFPAHSHWSPLCCAALSTSPAASNYFIHDTQQHSLVLSSFIHFFAYLFAFNRNGQNLCHNQEHVLNTMLVVAVVWFVGRWSRRILGKVATGVMAARFTSGCLQGRRPQWKAEFLHTHTDTQTHIDCKIPSKLYPFSTRQWFFLFFCCVLIFNLEQRDHRWKKQTLPVYVRIFDSWFLGFSLRIT